MNTSKQPNNVPLNKLFEYFTFFNIVSSIPWIHNSDHQVSSYDTAVVA